MALAFDLPFLQMLAYGAVFELHTSFLQSRVFSRLAGELTYTPRPAPGEIVFPESGPHNLRQGFNRLPEFSSRLGAQGYRIVQQAHFSPRLIRYAERGTAKTDESRVFHLFAIYSCTCDSPWRQPILHASAYSGTRLSARQSECIPFSP
jgi:hypothetical protein